MHRRAQDVVEALRATSKRSGVGVSHLRDFSDDVAYLMKDLRQTRLSPADAVLVIIAGLAGPSDAAMERLRPSEVRRVRRWHSEYAKKYGHPDAFAAVALETARAMRDLMAGGRQLPVQAYETVTEGLYADEPEWEVGPGRPGQSFDYRGGHFETTLHELRPRPRKNRRSSRPRRGSRRRRSR